RASGSSRRAKATSARETFRTSFSRAAGRWSTARSACTTAARIRASGSRRRIFRICSIGCARTTRGTRCNGYGEPCAAARGSQRFVLVSVPRIAIVAVAIPLGSRDVDLERLPLTVAHDREQQLLAGLVGREDAHRVLG